MTLPLSLTPAGKMLHPAAGMGLHKHCFTIPAAESRVAQGPAAGSRLGQLCFDPHWPYWSQAESAAPIGQLLLRKHVPAVSMSTLFVTCP